MENSNALKIFLETGMCTDEQLKELLTHYSQLEQMLHEHIRINQMYTLVWIDVNSKLISLRDMHFSRDMHRQLSFDRSGQEKS